jgi:outer membrane protein OmpA-like peptidoglycan-associated protein
MRNLTIVGGLFIILGLTQIAYSQRKKKELIPGYYIVVGAYAPSKENVAKHYTEVLTKRGIPADYGFNSSRRFFFVYINYLTNLRDALVEMQRVRQQTSFTDAWVRVVPGDIPPQRVESTENSDLKTETVKQPQPDTISIQKQPVETPSVTIVKRDTVMSDSLTTFIEKEKRSPAGPVGLSAKEVYAVLYHGRDNRIVDGSIKVIDTERARFLKEVRGNEFFKLPDPKTESKQLTLICEAFGYRKVQEEVSYPLLLADTVKENIDMMGASMVITFELVRYHRGDIATMYNVFFYNDAAIMLPESTYELNTLLQMMQENPNYRIRLHGHSNGNYYGAIKTIGGNRNFFSMYNSNSGFGSAKELAKSRAEVIKEYLVSKGIDATRIEIKSWGGKRPIYDRHSVNAKRNVRVEVEILDE